MKRALLCVPLLGLAPLGFFAGWYFEGAGVIDFGTGIQIGIVSTLLLPWIVAGAIAMLIRGKWPVRVLAFWVALLLQPVLTFKGLPPGYTCEMMGLAHKVRREYSTESLEICADQLRQALRDKSLKLVADSSGRVGSIFGDGVRVEDSELPASFRGRFTSVVLWHVPDGYGTQVRFGLDERTEIISGQSETDDPMLGVRPIDEYPLASGLHLYRFHR